MQTDVERWKVYGGSFEALSLLGYCGLERLPVEVYMLDREVQTSALGVHHRWKAFGTTSLSEKW